MVEIIIGFIISLAIAMTGVGAGTITAPVLILFLGVEPAMAIGTALVFSLIVKIPVSLSYLGKKMVNGEILMLMSLGGIPGVIAGSFLLGSLSKNQQVKSVIVAGIGLIVFISALLNLIYSVKKPQLQHRNSFKKIIPFFTFLIGMEVGFSSAGAGAMGTLLLLAATSLLPRQVVATDILFGLILSFVGGGIHLSMGHLDYGLLLLLSIGAVCGIPVGIYASYRVPHSSLKKGLLFWIMFIGILLMYRAFW
ncbi:MAG: sulfite exporter TauE/SafE family protein [Spirochaetia bacterium]|nr:sulfite exporter TauE/SafE family protein [Spirochaetia bacterium]